MEHDLELYWKTWGPEMTCSHCSVLWSQIDHRVRVGSGVAPAKSVRKIINKGKNVGRVGKTLVKKALKNSENKTITRCSFCSRSTIINMAKPIRQKPIINVIDSNKNETPVNKKRKKRTKDKTAGLTIAHSQNSQESKKTPQVKPTNLNKLGAMINKNLTPSKKSSLHDFIMELDN